VTADRQNVKETIRRLLAERGEVSSRDIQSAAGLTRQGVHYHLAELAKSGEIVSVGSGPATRYRLPSHVARRFPLEGLEEHVVWAEVRESDDRLRALPDNALSIVGYAFTEMLNNAIEHSRGTYAEIVRWTDPGRVLIEIADDGIGAFRNFRTKFKLADDFAAIQEISKGKLTTDPAHHTGQGIFFTSKAVDRFEIEANRLRWTVDNIAGDQGVGDGAAAVGTRVRFDVDPRTERTLRSVFDEYSDVDEHGFSRSRTAVRLFTSGDRFVSRSEAKRLAHGLERFSEVLVDFNAVTDVGQGFVDELFRVWASDHPDTRLRPINMSPAVEAMVRRGLPTSH
jgi:anti-sigma regulatory factor (Ser/Thr protein kinase)